MSHRLLACLAPLLTAAAACGSDDDSDPEMYNCEAEDRDEDFTAGMQKTGAGGMTFTLVSSTPAPPARNDNVWVIDVTSGGQPFDGTVDVVPFMPDHRHGTSIEAIITPVAGTPGRYNVEKVNLFMPGLWEVTVEARPTETTSDSAIFRFCITG